MPMPFVASWSFAFVEFAVVLYIVLLTGFCIAVIISALLGKTTWLRPPEETPKQKARREALQARADLRAKAIMFELLGPLFWVSRWA
jgi:hypothetical protein